MKKLTSRELKMGLWDTFQKLQQGKIEPEVAVALGKVSSEICKITYLEINAARQLDSDNSFVDREMFIPTRKATLLGEKQR